MQTDIFGEGQGKAIMAVHVFVTDDRRNALGKAMSGSYDVAVFLSDRSTSIIYVPDRGFSLMLSGKKGFLHIGQEAGAQAFSSDIGETAVLDMLKALFGSLKVEYELLYESDGDGDFYSIGMI